MSETLKEQFIDNYVEKLRLIFPEKKKKALYKIVKDEVEKSYEPQQGFLHNNYTNVKEELNTEEIIDYIQETKAITSGRGVLYKQHSETINPGALMLQDLGAGRKAQKKLMLEALGNKDYDLAKFHDNRQKNFKVIMNSFFGVLLQSSSHFFNPYCGLSIMGKGRSIISHIAFSFERFLFNNYKFISFEEFMNFVDNTLKEEYKSEDCIDIHISKKKLLKYFKARFDENVFDVENYEMVLEKVIDNLDQNERDRLFYKNNLFKFLENTEVFELLEKICSTDLEFSVAELKVPDGVDEKTAKKYKRFFNRVEFLWSLLNEWVFYNYPIYNRMNKIKSHKRKAVLLVDTDSNFINLDKWLHFLKKKELINLKDKVEKFRMINVMAVYLTNVANAVCWDYSINSGIIKEEELKKLNMKNEFYYYRLLLTENKKWYVGSIGIKEGKVLNPPSIDIKGMAFKKASFNAEIGDKIEKIMVDYILNAEKIDLIALVRAVRELEDYIRDDILSGSTKLWTPAKINSLSSYQDITKMASVKAGLAFNRIYPRDAMSFPNQVKMIKLKDVKMPDIQFMKEDFPEEYENLKGMLMDNSIKYEFNRIALPTNIKECPKWIIPLIDIHTVVRNSLSAILPILKSANIRTVATTKNAEYTSTMLF